MERPHGLQELAEVVWSLSLTERCFEQGLKNITVSQHDYFFNHLLDLPFYRFTTFLGISILSMEGETFPLPCHAV